MSPCKPTSALALLLLSGCLYAPFEADSVEDVDPVEAASQGDAHIVNNVYHATRSQPCARDFLSARRFPSLTIEVDYVAGCRPSDYALENLERIASWHCDKPEGIRVWLDDEIPFDPATFQATAERCRETGERYCDLDRSGESLGLYVLYWPYLQGEGTLGRDGAALDFEHSPDLPNLAIFLRTVEANARLHVSKREVEAFTLVHEFGHQLGLVDNPSHQKWDDWPHCTHPECVMLDDIGFARALFGNLFWDPVRVLLGGMPKDFCRDCLADLETYRG